MRHTLTHRLSPLAVLTAAVAIGGCNQKYRVDSVLSTDEKDGIPWKERSDTGFMTDVEKINPYTYNGKEVGSYADSLYFIASNDTDETKRKQARNQLQSAIMRISDETTAVHLTSIKASENNINLLLGIPAIGMSAAAAVSPLGAANSLSAASTGLQGSRSFVIEQVFRNTLFDSIILLIEEDRRTVRDVIRGKYDKSITEYNVESAIQDATDYHQRGSFYHGLALLADAANDKANMLRGSRDRLEKPGVLQSFLSKTDIERANTVLENESRLLQALRTRLNGLENEKKGINKDEGTEDERKKKQARLEAIEKEIEATTKSIADGQKSLDRAKKDLEDAVKKHTDTMTGAS
jgi:hypothetical protein